MILYNEYTASGVNVREFCRARGIKENRFYYWIKMLKSQALSALDTPREFIPISPGAVNRLKTLSLCLVLQPQIGFIYTLILLICARASIPLVVLLPIKWEWMFKMATRLSSLISFVQP